MALPVVSLATRPKPVTVACLALDCVDEPEEDVEALPDSLST